MWYVQSRRMEEKYMERLVPHVSDELKAGHENALNKALAGETKRKNKNSKKMSERYDDYITKYVETGNTAFLHKSLKFKKYATRASKVKLRDFILSASTERNSVTREVFAI